MTISTETALQQASPDVLLRLLVQHFNDCSQQLDDANEDRARYEHKYMAAKLALVIANDRLVVLQQDNERLQGAARESEQIAKANASLQVEQQRLVDQHLQLHNELTALQAEYRRGQGLIQQLQNEIAALRGDGSPKKLREQIKRLKSTNAGLVARIAQLERDGNKASGDLRVSQRQQIECHSAIRDLRVQLAHNTGSGLFHQGEHHLVIWPQRIKMERLDGSVIEARTLLYMHQSGRGALLTYSEEDGIMMCTSPKGGLRPSKDTMDFADKWLQKVNVQQKGLVQEADMIALDLNSQEKAA